jgi:hypothetical protein
MGSPIQNIPISRAFNVYISAYFLAKDGGCYQAFRGKPRFQAREFSWLKISVTTTSVLSL